MLKSISFLIKNSNENLLLYGGVCIIASLFCLFLNRFSSVEIEGVNAWIKPFKFFTSIATFSITMAIYISFLNDTKQVNYYSWSFIILMTIELALIVYQGAQGKKSHFNMDTPKDKLIFNMMAIAIIITMLHTLYIFILFFTQKQFQISDKMVLAIQLGLVVMILFAFEGLIMGGNLKHSVGSDDIISGTKFFNWNNKFGDLRVAHFFGIHALQIIPIASYYLAKTKREVLIIAVTYFIFVTYTFIKALAGKPFLKI